VGSVGPFPPEPPAPSRDLEGAGCVRSRGQRCGVMGACPEHAGPQASSGNGPTLPTDRTRQGRDTGWKLLGPVFRSRSPLAAGSGGGVRCADDGGSPFPDSVRSPWGSSQAANTGSRPGQPRETPNRKPTETRGERSKPGPRTNAPIGRCPVGAWAETRGAWVPWRRNLTGSLAPDSNLAQGPPRDRAESAPPWGERGTTLPQPRDPRSPHNLQSRPTQERTRRQFERSEPPTTP